MKAEIFFFVFEKNWVNQAIGNETFMGMAIVCFFTF